MPIPLFVFWNSFRQFVGEDEVGVARVTARSGGGSTRVASFKRLMGVAGAGDVNAADIDRPAAELVLEVC